jgi:hypothetical protein
MGARKRHIVNGDKNSTRQNTPNIIETRGSNTRKTARSFLYNATTINDAHYPNSKTLRVCVFTFSVRDEPNTFKAPTSGL